MDGPDCLMSGERSHMVGSPSLPTNVIKIDQDSVNEKKRRRILKSTRVASMRASFPRRQKKGNSQLFSPFSVSSSSSSFFLLLLFFFFSSIDRRTREQRKYKRNRKNYFLKKLLFSITKQRSKVRGRNPENSRPSNSGTESFPENTDFSELGSEVATEVEGDEGL